MVKNWGHYGLYVLPLVGLVISFLGLVNPCFQLSLWLKFFKLWKIQQLHPTLCTHTNTYTHIFFSHSPNKPSCLRNLKIKIHTFHKNPNSNQTYIHHLQHIHLWQHWIKKLSVYISTHYTWEVVIFFKGKANMDVVWTEHCFHNQNEIQPPSFELTTIIIWLTEIWLTTQSKVFPCFPWLEFMSFFSK